MVLVPGSNGKNIKEAYSDIFHSIQPDPKLALLVQSAIETCSNSFQNTIDDNVARIPDGNQANHFLKVTVQDNFNETSKSTILIPCNDANLKINWSVNGSHITNFYGTIEDDENPAGS